MLNPFANSFDVGQSATLQRPLQRSQAVDAVLLVQHAGRLGPGSLTLVEGLMEITGVAGAAGQIGYQLCFRIAAGDMLGPDQPVILQLIEIEPALASLRTSSTEKRQKMIETLSVFDSER